MTLNRRLFLAAAGEPLAAGAASADAAPVHDSVVDELVRRATAGHVALMRGDIARYRTFLLLGDDFTLMSPFGGEPSRGGRLSDEAWAAIGRFFRDGSQSTLELVQTYASPGLVVLAAIERSHVAVGAIPAQDWALRVTLVFRREGETWKLVHRHADPLVEAISVAESAALARSPRPAL
jgi:ketosteroid isomerase-like protein